MTIDKLEVVFYTAAFVLPGFIISSIVNSTNPRKETSDSLAFLKYLALSLVHIGCLGWLYVRIFAIEIDLWVKWLILSFVTIIGAVLIGLVIVVFVQRRIIEKTLSLLGLRYIAPIPTAWDYFFSQQKISIIRVTLKDDSVVSGWYSDRSLASSSSKERDLYIEKCFIENESEEWILDEDSDGIYIPYDQIKYLEFRKVKPEVKQHGTVGK